MVLHLDAIIFYNENQRPILFFFKQETWARYAIDKIIIRNKSIKLILITNIKFQYQAGLSHNISGIFTIWNESNCESDISDWIQYSKLRFLFI